MEFLHHHRGHCRNSTHSQAAKPEDLSDVKPLILHQSGHEILQGGHGGGRPQLPMQIALAIASEAADSKTSAVQPALQGTLCVPSSFLYTS